MGMDQLIHDQILSETRPRGTHVSREVLYDTYLVSREGTKDAETERLRY